MQAPNLTTYDGLNMTSPVEYASIKGSILKLVQYMMSYLGEHNVRVNAVSPGGVFDGQNPEFVANYRQRTPLERMASRQTLWDRSCFWRRTQQDTSQATISSSMVAGLSVSQTDYSQVPQFTQVLVDEVFFNVVVPGR